jgi:hypothetical protein
MEPLYYHNKQVPGYFVQPNGSIFNFKNGKLRYLKYRVSGQVHYPKTDIYIDGEKKSIAIHILVCYTYHRNKKPIPLGVDPKVWAKTPKQVKDAWPYQVNHIDHNINNYHPDNLEFVSTPLENSIKYQEYRKKEADNSIEHFFEIA